MSIPSENNAMADRRDFLTTAAPDQRRAFYEVFEQSPGLSALDRMDIYAND